MSLKQVILVRSDLKLPKGKMASQVSHASVESTLKSNKKLVKNWRDDGMKKIVLKVRDKEELLKYKKEAEEAGLTATVITDAGHTVVEPGTMTCIAIGPDGAEKIDKITGNLKMI